MAKYDTIFIVIFHDYFTGMRLNLKILRDRLGGKYAGNMRGNTKKLFIC